MDRLAKVLRHLTMSSTNSFVWTGSVAWSGKRYEALDGLRGLAALAVVLYHVRWDNHLTGIASIRHGFLFVDLCFMLSGFVLSAAYSESLTDTRAFIEFITLRFFRLYPVHLVVLLGLIGIETMKLMSAQ